MSVQTQQARQSKVVIGAIVVAVIALLYIVYTYAMNGKSKQQSQVSGLANTHGVDSKESEHYQQVLNKYNNEQSDKADQSGKTYLSILSTNSADVPQTQQQPQLPPPPAPVQVQYQQQQPVQEQQSAAQSDEQLQVQVQGMMKGWSSQQHGIARVAADGKEYVQSLQATTNAQNGILPSGQKIPAYKVVDDFALVPAILGTDLDTDENSVVTATVPTGKYQGAILYAMGYRRITNTIDMTFTAMQFNGRSYKITAKPVDQHSMRTSLSGDVSNRYFSRIIIPALATGIGKAGQLYAQAASQNIITPQGGVIQTYPEAPSGKAVGGTIAGGFAEQTGRVLASDASQIPIKQVVVPKGVTIGIQFIGPVLSSDDMSQAANQQAPDNKGTGIDTSAVSKPASDANSKYPMPQPSQPQQPMVGYQLPAAYQSSPGAFPPAGGQQ